MKLCLNGDDRKGIVHCERNERLRRMSSERQQGNIIDAIEEEITEYKSDTKEKRDLYTLKSKP